MGTAPAQGPRSLAEDLRARSDEELAALFRLRPDLISPIPADLARLSTRATTPASVTRVVDRLDRFRLAVVEALALLPEPASPGDVARSLGGEPDETRAGDGGEARGGDVAAALASLRALALTWGSPAEVHLVRAARHLVLEQSDGGPSLSAALATYGSRRLAILAADLGLPATGDAIADAWGIASHLGQRAVVEEMLGQAPPPARELLGRLATGPAYGMLRAADRPVSVATAQSPVEWLLARGLLVSTDPSTVALPREIAVSVTSRAPASGAAARPPAIRADPRDPALVDRTAAGSAYALVRGVEDLLELWAAGGPAVLRAGGLGVRELRRASTLLAAEPGRIALLAEVAYTSGLLAPNGDFDERWWPTPDYDQWRALPDADRWLRLVLAWLASSRIPSLVGERDARDKGVNALSPEVERADAADLRRVTLDALAAADPGTAPDPADIAESVAWHRPRRGGRMRDRLVAWALREASDLGLLGMGSLSSAGRNVLEGREDEARRALAPLLPVPVDSVLIQADLTAVAPGPLVPALAANMALVADVESKGAATVYRFSESSVRRALDAGRTAGDLHRLLAAASKTPVPQPLTYLVNDLARRHGRVRVGTAGAYVRCDDEAVLAELLAHRRAARLRLRALAPTVLVTSESVEVTLDVLRDLGYAPMAEHADGSLAVRRPPALRTAPRQPPAPLSPEPPSPSERLLRAAVRSLRAGDATAQETLHRALPGLEDGRAVRPSVAEILAVLQAAVTTGTALWIGYVNADGQASERVVEPLTVEGGYVSAFDHLRDEVRTFAVSRITGVAVLTGEGSPR